MAALRVPIAGGAHTIGCAMDLAGLRPDKRAQDAFRARQSAKRSWQNLLITPGSSACER
jgi:hypothetical protein